MDVLSMTINKIPPNLLELESQNALLSMTNKKLTKFLYASIGVTLIFAVVLIIQKNEDRD